MAKRNNSIGFKGLLDVDAMQITEETKEGIFVYSVLDALREYDGKEVSLNIKEEAPVKPVDAEPNVEE
jgi:hypothetical protein